MIAWDHVLAKRAGEQFALRSVDKAYLALVNGVPSEKAGVVDAAIQHDESSEYPLFFVSEGGRPSVTKWEVEEDFGKVSLVRFLPQTGRTHQIRVHAGSYGMSGQMSCVARRQRQCRFLRALLKPCLVFLQLTLDTRSCATGGMAARKR